MGGLPQPSISGGGKRKRKQNLLTTTMTYLSVLLGRHRCTDRGGCALLDDLLLLLELLLVGFNLRQRGCHGRAGLWDDLAVRRTITTDPSVLAQEVRDVYGCLWFGGGGGGGGCSVKHKGYYAVVV